MRQPGCHRSADPRRCRLAQFAAGRRAGEHRAPATAALRPGTEPRRKHLGVSARQRPQQLRLETYEAILDACCDAWNVLMAKSNVITSIGTREWAQVRI